MLTEEQNDILVGSILGDATVELSRRSTQLRDSTCRIRFDHSIRQRDYVHWKFQKLQPYSAKIRQSEVLDSRTERSGKKIRFDTYTKPIFAVYHRIFYVDNVKCVPQDINDLLRSKLTLAVWFLDDGALRVDCHSFRIHTEAFTLEMVELLQNALAVNFGINCGINIHRNRGSKLSLSNRGFILTVPSKNGEAERWNELLKPLVAKEIPTMLYKFF